LYGRRGKLWKRRRWTKQTSTIWRIRGNNFQRPPFSRPGKFGGNQYQNTQRFGGGRANSSTKAEVNMDKAHNSSAAIRAREEELVI
jgi:hypothetical protein